MRTLAISLLFILIALPAAAERHSRVQKGEGGEVEVSGSDQTNLKSFHYTPARAELTIGGTTFNIVFESNGSVTLNGVNAKTNEEILDLIARSGSVLSAAELDDYIGMMEAGEIQIEPKKRGEAILQLLVLWRGKV